MALAIRTSSDPAALTSAVLRELRALDPSQPVFNVHAMREVVYGSLAGQRFRTVLMGIFAALALVLAALGLYGVVAYSVSQRTAELGIRIALGAQPRGILQLVVFRTAALAALGLGIGVAVTLGGSRIVARFLFGISPADPVTLATVSVVILLVALTGSWVPALRAARVDPATALRAE
jgi:putative ABC transport system permease protein